MCYNCDSKWHQGHECVTTKLFVIEGIDEGEALAKEQVPKPDPRDFSLEEFPKISLNAITGTPSPKTMKLVGVLNNQRVVILIDSGSMHNFLD